MLSLPFFRTQDVCRVDWMHVMDLGVSADFLGGLFLFVLHRLPGANKAQRLQALRDMLDASYARVQPDARIDAITESMLKGSSGHGKLKGHATEVRCMVPVGVDVARQALDPADPVQMTILAAMDLLHDCYQGLSRGEPEARAARPEKSRRFCALFIALSVQTEEFHVRPKLHLMQELLEMDPSSDPVASWTYRDEDYGGSAVSLFRPRGGARSAATAGMHVLLKFCARHRVPSLARRA